MGLELALLALQERGIHDVDALVHGDNTGAIGAYAKGRGRNLHTNDVLRRMHWVSQAENMAVVPRYVKSEDNLADPISRGKFGARADWVDFRFELPVDLDAYLEHVML